jgi:FkbM family methyltransferase
VTNKLRDLIRDMAPDSVARLVRRVFLWKRRAQFRPYKITRIVGDDSFPFRIADTTGELWYGRRKVISPELPFILGQMLSPDDLVFDVGAHHGFWTVCMARHSGHVLSIEPNPHNVAILKGNIELNALKNVTICQVAVGVSTGKIPLLQDSDHGGVLPPKLSALPTIDVELVTLNQLAREYGFPQMLKIDVEGFEANVLRGASEVLIRHPKIAIEVHVDWVSRYGASVSEVVNLLDLKSYRVWVLPHNGEIQPWDGKDFNRYQATKFTLFLMPEGLSKA